MANLQRNQLMQQMQREQSDMEMNGHRPQSPSSAENAPSPSKRPRLDNGPMNGQQLAPNGRGQGQGMPGQPNPMIVQNGLTRQMTPQAHAAFQQSGPGAQQKSIQVYAQNLALHHSRSAMNNQGMPNGLMNPGVMPNQTDLVPMPDGQGMYPMGNEYYGANGQMAQVRAGMQTPNGQHGNHALQDYQMQLMLLEQQNKRRLLMARQEQDNMTRADQPPMPGQALPPGTSPQGSRAGTSPNPSDQMKRGTPKMPQTGLPGSPSAADAMGQGRGSPASMNFNGAQMGPEMAGQFFPNGMRTPSSNPAFSAPQMGQPIPAGAANRVPSGSWPPQGPPQGQPMAPHQSPASQPTGTPQERGAMPPPQAPPATGPNAGRTQPPSPAPPTPQQGNKAPPKGKKDTKDTRKVCFLLSDLRCPFFIEHLLSALQRRRVPPPTPIPRPHPPKRSKRLRHQLLLNTKTRSTNQGRMQQQLLLNSQRLHLHLSLWCNNNSRHRRQTRSRRLMISAALSQT